jgi:hypothetical protein
MAIVKKNLVALNDNVELDVPTDFGAIAAIQYGAGGLGTIELQGTVDGGATWFTIQLLKPDGTVAATNLAAAGVGYNDVSYCDKVRINKTVAGAGAVAVVLSLALRGGPRG